LVDFVHGQDLGEVNDAVDSLHPDTVLVVLEQLGEDLEQLLIWGLRNQLNHIVQNQAAALPDLRDFVVACLRKQVDDILLMTGTEVQINHRKQLNC
jgi:hypothetical protein